jgi:hypothetical protein
LIDAQEVENLFIGCLYKNKQELSKDAVVVEGVINKFVFDPKQLEKHKERITELLGELPVQFRRDSGGGWSFLNACMTKDNKQWTGLHLRMEQLFALGMAIGKVKFQFPRSMWKILPGGMPYVVLDL